MTEEKIFFGGCGCGILIFVFNLLLGAWSVNYILALFGKHLPTFWAIISGLFVGEFSIPAAFIVWILKHCGVI